MDRYELMSLGSWFAWASTRNPTRLQVPQGGIPRGRRSHAWLGFKGVPANQGGQLFEHLRPATGATSKSFGFEVA
jgi:hypothetical protein